MESEAEGLLLWLMDQGLEPQHVLLDIGCGKGKLRSVVGYLDEGNYYGFDRAQEVVYKMGEPEKFFGHHPDRSTWMCAFDQFEKLGLFAKRPTVWLSDRFNVAPLAGRKADFIFCKDVWTHFTPKMIKRCLDACSTAIADDGVMYASFTVSKSGKYHEGPDSYFGAEYKDNTAYTVEGITKVASEAGWDAELMETPCAPHNQTLRLTRRS